MRKTYKIIKKVFFVFCLGRERFFEKQNKKQQYVILNYWHIPIISGYN